VNQIDLQNRHAVVTGGAQGIGFSIATRLQESGASVSIWDHDPGVLETAIRELEKTGQVTGEVVDVSEAASVDRAVKSTINKHQRIDILVANAGIAGPNHTTWEYPVEEWHRHDRQCSCCPSPCPHAGNNDGVPIAVINRALKDAQIIATGSGSTGSVAGKSEPA
jgi:3-oxoacyl-[acyl-carrier protein] reductase